MRNKIAALLLIGTSLVFSPAVMAGEHGEGGESKEHAGKFKGEHGGDWEKFKNMSPEEREKFKAERKAKWEALSDSEKVKMIEEKRAKRMQEMDSRWKSMSDAEKIKFAEERMKRGHHGGKKGEHGGFGGDKAGPGGEGKPVDKTSGVER